MSGIYDHRCRRCEIPIRIAWQGWSRKHGLRGIYTDENEGDVCESNENGRHQI